METTTGASKFHWGNKTRTCDTNCSWGNWNTSSCQAADCNPGATMSCGDCGTKTCGDDGRWGNCSCTGSANCNSSTCQCNSGYTWDGSACESENSSFDIKSNSVIIIPSCCLTANTGWPISYNSAPCSGSSAIVCKGRAQYTMNSGRLTTKCADRSNTTCESNDYYSEDAIAPTCNGTATSTSSYSRCSQIKMNSGKQNYADICNSSGILCIEDDGLDAASCSYYYQHSCECLDNNLGRSTNCSTNSNSSCYNSISRTYVYNPLPIPSQATLIECVSK
jgi:hypothetical protein